MEREFERYYLLAAIFLVAMLDLFVRWLRGRTRRDQPAGDSGVDEVVVQDAEESDVELLEQWPVEDQEPPPVPPPYLRPPLPVRPPAPVLAALPAAAPMRRHRARRWLWQPVDARRGIVLMEILRPCRGLEPPSRDV